MDGDETEMSREECWIIDKAKETQRVSPDLLEKCNQLQSLLKRREEQAACLLRLCESVAACEDTVKKLYSLLEWEYSDTDLDDDNNQASCGQASPLSCKSAPSDTQVHRPLASDGSASFSSKPKDSEKQERVLRKKHPLALKSPVVVLTRMTGSQMTSSLSPPSPQNHWSEDESLGTDGSDMQWEPSGDSSDTDFSISSTRSNKRKKMAKKNGKHTKNDTTHQERRNSIRSGAKTSTLTTNAESSAKSSPVKTLTQQAGTVPDAKGKTAKSSQADTNTSAESKATKTSTKPASASEDGRVKYKVNFKEKGRSLVSGHHIAFEHMPKVNELLVGARVVVRSKDDQFVPGFMAEVPSRKNRMRFLIFTDDHTPVYASLRAMNMVCKPLENPLDDILDEKHKLFMQNYLKKWPYPPMTQYHVGQTVNVERNGFLQRCKVLEIDCSLMEVVFLDDDHKEWIYRGSSCLEQMISVNENLNKT
ncbi:dual specificity protein kinase CLK2 isoform X6 [Simochromis diagramma]|uniref:dual specificity protein kinase CLK2 isoform X6 n=1 Tax=Simochromis diagramma TaxID=43689 RepID=UPI001A7F10FA|nr:dual specificity protein kinase CLK2 isoform X6 [Simochromis diagramma]